MNARQYILMKIAEEATEVAQRALKAQQFGLDQTEPGKTQNNAERLEGELLDLGFWFQVATANDMLSPMTMDAIDGHRETKLPVAVQMFFLAMAEGQLDGSGDITF